MLIYGEEATSDATSENLRSQTFALGWEVGEFHVNATHKETLEILRNKILPIQITKVNIIVENFKISCEWIKSMWFN